MFAGLIRFAITVAALPVCARFMNGVAMVDLHNTVIVGVLLAVIYTLLRPLLRLLLSVINFCTMGLVYVAIDAWLVWTAAGLVENSVAFKSFWWAIAVALALNAARMLVDVVTDDAHR